MMCTCTTNPNFAGATPNQMFDSIASDRYTIEIIYKKAAVGNLEYLKNTQNISHLLSNEVMDKICMIAASRGYTHILEWAPQRGYKLTKEICEAGAFFGKKNVIEWAIKNNCPWDEQTCISALRGGHLDIMQWAIDNGCPVLKCANPF